MRRVDERYPCRGCDEDYNCSHAGAWRSCDTYRAYLHSRWQWPTRERLDLRRLARYLDWRV